MQIKATVGIKAQEVKKVYDRVGRLPKGDEHSPAVNTSPSSGKTKPHPPRSARIAAESCPKPLHTALKALALLSTQDNSIY